MSRSPVRVLVVDDSAVVRQAMAQVLGADPDLEVEVAADPLIARQKIARRRPDVILLDLVMPRMDGMTFLQSVMETDPIPVVICSGYVGEHSAQAVLALERGAVDIVAKPQQGVREFVEEASTRLRGTVKAASRAQLSRRSARDGVAMRRVEGPPRPSSLKDLSITVNRVVAVGASTGGTEALSTLLGAMPAGAPALLIVQHMPAGFTRAFANRLNETSRMEVREAAPGDVVEPGLALVAPGDRHLTVRRRGAILEVQLHQGPTVSGHRPSVDLLFRSVAEVVGARAIGVLLTGMGADGAEGLLEMRNAGAHTVAQDESTSVIFGMPKEAIRRGAVGAVLPLGCIADHVLRRSCSYGPGAGVRAVSSPSGADKPSR